MGAKTPVIGEESECDWFNWIGSLLSQTAFSRGVRGTVRERTYVLITTILPGRV